MSVTFKCNRSGQTVTFEMKHDIESMRQHPEYSEVVFLEEKQVFSAEAQPKRGRPKKVVEDIDTDSV
jgi:uncharacterized lipoprotein NlpE involved in copper resistance